MQVATIHIHHPDSVVPEKAQRRPSGLILHAARQLGPGELANAPNRFELAVKLREPTWSSAAPFDRRATNQRRSHSQPR